MIRMSLEHFAYALLEDVSVDTDVGGKKSVIGPFPLDEKGAPQ